MKRLQLQPTKTDAPFGLGVWRWSHKLANGSHKLAHGMVPVFGKSQTVGVDGAALGEVAGGRVVDDVELAALADGLVDLSEAGDGGGVFGLGRDGMGGGEVLEVQGGPNFRSLWRLRKFFRDGEGGAFLEDAGEVGGEGGVVVLAEEAFAQEEGEELAFAHLLAFSHEGMTGRGHG